VGLAIVVIEIHVEDVSIGLGWVSRLGRESQRFIVIGRH
jgi:hypothetical protein